MTAFKEHDIVHTRDGQTGTVTRIAGAKALVNLHDGTDRWYATQTLQHAE